MSEQRENVQDLSKMGKPAAISRTERARTGSAIKSCVCWYRENVKLDLQMQKGVENLDSLSLKLLRRSASPHQCGLANNPHFL